MSEVFYDHLVDLGKLEKRIKKIARTQEERDELYELVDDILHHRILGCILDRLPKDSHEEFLTKFGERPHDENLLQYLAERVKEDVEHFIKYEAHKLVMDLMGFVEEKTRPEFELVRVGGKKKRKRLAAKN